MIANYLLGHQLKTMVVMPRVPKEIPEELLQPLETSIRHHRVHEEVDMNKT